MTAKRKPGRPTSYSESDVRSWSARHPAETYLAIAESAGRPEPTVASAIAKFRKAFPDEAKAAIDAINQRRALIQERNRRWLDRAEDESLSDIAASENVSVCLVSKAVDRLRRSLGIIPRPHKRWTASRGDEATVIVEQFGDMAAQICGLSQEQFRNAVYANPEIEIDPDVDIAIKRGFAMARCLLLDVTPADLIRCEAVLARARRARLDELAEARS